MRREQRKRTGRANMSALFRTDMLSWVASTGIFHRPIMPELLSLTTDTQRHQHDHPGPALLQYPVAHRPWGDREYETRNRESRCGRSEGTLLSLPGVLIGLINGTRRRSFMYEQHSEVARQLYSWGIKWVEKIYHIWYISR
jgi:hypothetical protein